MKNILIRISLLMSASASHAKIVNCFDLKEPLLKLQIEGIPHHNVATFSELATSVCTQKANRFLPKDVAYNVSFYNSKKEKIAEFEQVVGQSEGLNFSGRCLEYCMSITVDRGLYINNADVLDVKKAQLPLIIGVYETAPGSKIAEVKLNKEQKRHNRSSRRDQFN